MIYLASPHSHESEFVRHVRYMHAVQAAAHYAAKGFHIFSPIAHSHPIALEMQRAGMPHEKMGYDYWQAFDEHMMRHCAELWILTIGGWLASKGVSAEIEFMSSLQKPIAYITVGVDGPEYSLEYREDANAARGIGK